MKLKKLLYITAITVGCGLQTACNDDYLQKIPEDGINQEAFFKTVSDLETYTNGFYGMIGASYDDLFSDNIGHGTGDYTFSQKLKGRIDETTIGSFGWGKGGVWENIYNINFMLVNADQAEGDESEKKHYIGLARLCRALQYYGIIKNYGSAWYSAPIANDDEEALYKTQDSRELVVENIMADLQYACDNMQESDSRTRLTRYAALGYMAHSLARRDLPQVPRGGERTGRHGKLFPRKGSLGKQRTHAVWKIRNHRRRRTGIPRPVCQSGLEQEQGDDIVRRL